MLRFGGRGASDSRITRIMGVGEKTWDRSTVRISAYQFHRFGFKLSIKQSGKSRSTVGKKGTNNVSSLRKRSPDGVICQLTTKINYYDKAPGNRQSRQGLHYKHGQR